MKYTMNCKVHFLDTSIVVLLDRTRVVRKKKKQIVNGRVFLSMDASTFPSTSPESSITNHINSSC